MNIQRINTYSDPRFSPAVLAQHGAFLLDGTPVEIEIISATAAVVRGAALDKQTALMDEFRFYAEHITQFFNESGRLIAQYPPVELFSVALEDIQPSQFYVDEDKVQQVETFIRQAEDVIVPLLRADGRYISLDGHTRLHVACQRGYSKVLGFLSSTDDYIYDFAREAARRGVHSPQDLQKIAHDQYETLWNNYCDAYFAKKEEDAP